MKNYLSKHFFKNDTSSIQFTSAFLIIFIIFCSFVSNIAFAQTNYWTLGANSDIYNTNNNNPQSYVGIGTSTFRTPLVAKLQLFMPNPALVLNGRDRLSILLEADMSQNCHSFGELAVARAPYLFPFITNYSSFAVPGDIVLRAGGNMGGTYDPPPTDCNANLIITNRHPNGRIKFATTKNITGNLIDDEIMTVFPRGTVGILSTNDKNVLSVSNLIGIGQFGDMQNYDNSNFNCYAYKDAGIWEHRAIQSGHSSVIQSSPDGSLFLGVSGDNPIDNKVHFFEPSGRMGIMIQNQGIGNSSHASIGIGGIPNNDSRVTIVGWTDDNTKNALEVFNFTSSPSSTWTKIFQVRNDGLVSIGNKIFVPAPAGGDLVTEMKLSVDGAIVAKEILVNMTDAKWQWPDFVFQDDYKLMSLSELESSINSNRKLPGVPSAEEVCKNGINLTNMDAKLLQKIEELTLYLIQLKNDNEVLKNRINKLEIKN